MKEFLFMSLESNFVLLCIVVDGLYFAYNSPLILNTFKNKLSSKFCVQCFGALQYFISWDV